MFAAMTTGCWQTWHKHATVLSCAFVANGGHGQITVGNKQGQNTASP